MSSEDESSNPLPIERPALRLAAILHADVHGYSRRIYDDETGTLQVLTPSLALLRTLVQQHGGQAVGSRGDSLLAEFPSVVEAVQCAVEMQRGLKARNEALPENKQLAFRIGISLGEIVIDGDQPHGDGINIAVRIEGLAEPGGICLSEVVYHQVKNKLSLNYADLGEQQLKNIPEPVRVWRIVLDGSEGPQSTVLSAKVKGERQKPRWVSRSVFVSVFVLLLGGLVTLWSFFPSVFRIPHSAFRTQEAQPPSLPLPDKPSIAVLPFTNMSGDPEQEYFGDGMMEDLITDLSKLSGLFVVNFHSTLLYKGKAVKIQQVSRELGVRYILEGSVRKAGERILITAQLIDGTTGGHVWAERYERPLQDLFTLQEEVRRKILVHLGLKLTPEEEERLQRTYTPSLEAYSHVTRGIEALLRFTPAENARARQLFEKAIALDPTYAVAYAGLGMTYSAEWAAQWSHDPQVLDRAFELARQALALDDSSPPAHELLGVVYLLRDKQHEQAIAENKRAIAYSPNWFSAYINLAVALNFAGRPEETIANAEQALRLSPRSFHYLTPLGNAYRLTKRYEDAIATYKKILAVMPSHGGARLGLAVVYSELGQEEAARAEAAKVLRINPHFSLEALKERLPYKDPAELERHLAGLRKAGLK